MKQLSTRHNRARSVASIHQFSFTVLAPIVGVAMLLSLSIYSPLEAQGDDLLDPASRELPVPKVKAKGGDLDTSFSGDGIATRRFQTQSGSNLRMAIQSDDKIVALGVKDTATEFRDYVLARFNQNGSLDLTFGGGDGIATVRLDNIGQYFFLAIRPDGKIVVLGSRWSVAEGSTRTSMLRFNTNGSLDTAFGVSGERLVDGCGYPSALAVRTDNKMVLASRDAEVIRLNADGSRDTTFTSDNTIPPGSALALQPDGKVIVGTTVEINVDPDFALIRLNSNGTLDKTFNGDGIVYANIGTTAASGNTWDQLNDLVLQPNGNIVAVGRADILMFDPDTGDDFFVSHGALVRVRANGAIDTSFGNHGTIMTPQSSPIRFWGGIQAVALQVDGKIVTGGNAGTWPDPDSSFGVSRWNPTGTPDVTFGVGGSVATKLTVFPRDSFLSTVAIQPKDGRIVAGGIQGFSLDGSPDDLQFTFVRYHAITCAGYAATLVGTPENDTLRGTAGDDVIFGAGGDDRIFGLNGDDVLCGGSGNDTLFGGGGLDICDGGSGEDEEHGCEIVHSVP